MPDAAAPRPRGRIVRAQAPAADAAWPALFVARAKGA